MSDPAPTPLTLYFDGSCPFCRTEMRRIAQWNHARRLDFVDITAAGFAPEPLGVTMAMLDREMLARTSDGRLLWGLDAICAAYLAVGQGWRIAPLRSAPVRRLLTPLYRAFARRRHAMSTLLGYRREPETCADDRCDIRKIW